MLEDTKRLPWAERHIVQLLLVCQLLSNKIKLVGLIISFKAEDANGLKIMAKFTSHHSTYDGDGNKQKGASIFFSENFWTENENLYKSDNKYELEWHLKWTDKIIS